MRIANDAMKKGIQKGRMETIIKMLNLKLDEKIIKEVTGAKDTELDKIKKELLEA